MTPTMDARAIEVMARAMYEQIHAEGQMTCTPWDSSEPESVMESLRASWRRRASAALDALLQPTEPCEHREGGLAAVDGCPGCSGGLVQRPPLVILASQVEQVLREAEDALLRAVIWVSKDDQVAPINKVIGDLRALRRLRVEGEQTR